MQRYSKQASAWEDLRRVIRTLERTEPIAIPTAGETAPTPRFRLDQRLDSGTLARLVADYEAGASSNQLMQNHGIGKGSVLRLLRDAGVSIRNRRLSPAELESAVSIYRSGLSLKAVSEKLEFSIDAVRGGLLRAGVQLRRRNGWHYDA